ncbi:hypothetical protein SGPA1_50873 [Streptomyces misionensis JCM 4497]
MAAGNCPSRGGSGPLPLIHSIMTVCFLGLPHPSTPAPGPPDDLRSHAWRSSHVPCVPMNRS